MVKKTCWVLSLIFGLSFLGQVFAADTQNVSKEWLHDIAETAVRQYSGVSPQDLSVSLVSLTREITVPQGNIEGIAEIPAGVKYNMPTLVYVNVIVDGRLEARIMLRFNVKLYQNVVVAARPLAAREQLGADAVRYERLDIGRLAPGFLTDLNKAEGLVVRSAMQPGMVVTSYMLQKPVVIKHGSTVSIVARAGSLEVSTVGIAMQDGVLGQIIRVQNANSRKFMSAKVVDEANVLVTSFNRK